ncbi:kelch-like 2, Mayven [Orbilia oligospora]|uniref:Kelch-like 2, Mayven n=1 Tax=Orbilia oligospora TaxID=2813651 RepID=A0A8H8UPF9_ORBOL|nr:kelch-like 2, Mayven [Orbilia oligospora]
MASNESSINMGFKETPLYLYSKPDVTIVAGDEEIGVHEFVLASQSEFFKAALHCGLKESRERRITLPEIQPKAIFAVLNWLYRAPLVPYFQNNDPSHVFSKGSTESLKAILQAFDFLQIKGAGRDYCKFVEENLQKVRTSCYNRLGAPEASHIVIQVNEIYKSGGSITAEAMERLVCGIDKCRDYSHSYNSNEVYKSGGPITKEALAKLVPGIAADKSSCPVLNDFIEAL